MALVLMAVVLTAGTTATAAWVLTDAPGPLPATMVADVLANQLGVALSDGVAPQDVEIDHVDISLISGTVEPGHVWDGHYGIGFRTWPRNPVPN